VGHSLAADIHKVPAVVVDIPSAVQQHSIRSFEGIALVVDSRFQLGERGSGSLIRIGAGCVLVLGIAPAGASYFWDILRDMRVCASS
jgi:hypothetical protein